MSNAIFNRTSEERAKMLAILQCKNSANTEESKKRFRKMELDLEAQIELSYEERSLDKFIKELNGYDVFA